MMAFLDRRRARVAVDNSAFSTASAAGRAAGPARCRSVLVRAGRRRPGYRDAGAILVPAGAALVTGASSLL
jgi:hypothetical protein